MEELSEFLKDSPSAYHVCENAKSILLENGFELLSEADDWNICEGGKYFVERNGSAFIAFTVGALDDFYYKIAVAHTDSPALRLKENAVVNKGLYATLNVEKYGSNLGYTLFDRPLRIAGRIIRQEGAKLVGENVLSDFVVTIPSLAIHMQRGVNDGFSVNPQVDLQPLLGFADDKMDMQTLLSRSFGDNVVAYDLYLVNADMPYTFGINNEFLASPRIDNLTSVYSIIKGMLAHSDGSGICVAACFNNEEVGSLSAEGAESDFARNVLHRIASALRFDDNEYYKALASSFLLSLDNAHAQHPNHPEKSDTSNQTVLGGGVVIKTHANKAYITDAMSTAVVKALLDNANVPYQYFYNRSDMQSGSTLGKAFIRQVSVKGADIGLAQLAMHSACECFAKSDIDALVKALSAYYSSDILRKGESIIVQ